LLLLRAIVDERPAVYIDALSEETLDIDVSQKGYG
jgi:hypothetical protein